MKLKATIAAFQFSAAFLCLSTLLFTTELARMTCGHAGETVREIVAVCRDDKCQWVLVVCMLVYLAVFLCCEFRERNGLQLKIFPLEAGETPVSLKARSRHATQILLIAMIFLCLIGYAGSYPSSARSLQILTLVVGIVVGKAFAMWVNFPSYGDEMARCRAIRRLVSVLAMIIDLLLVAAFYQSDFGPAYAYHDICRWTGPWDNPNLFGLLMGAGVILAAGLGLGIWRIEDGRAQIAYKNRKRTFWKCLFILLCLIAAILLGIGLYHSLSRGAWLGTAVGLGYLFFNYAHSSRDPKMVGRTPHPGPLPIGSTDSADAERVRRSQRNNVGIRRVVQAFKARNFGEGEAISCHSCVSWLKENRLTLIAIVLSIFVISFWQLKFSQFQFAQRIASVANPNDFSWRNRVSAWLEAARMIIDKPLTGFGWSEAESIYAKRYCTTADNESAAIEMNDYLMMGISGGVPVMLCFMGYVALVLSGKGQRRITRILESDEALPKPFSCRGNEAQTSGTPRNIEPPDVGCYSCKRTSDEIHRSVSPSSIFYLPSSAQLITTCRAETIVLLVGFWFDGGLFKLPTAVVFWTLLELSRLEFIVPQTALASAAVERSSPPVNDEKRIAVKSNNDAWDGRAGSPLPAAVANERLRIHHDGVHEVTRPTCPNVIGNYRNRWLSRTAWCAVIAAVGVSAFYLFAPYLPVSDKTIAIARQYLILPKERADFDFLADKPIWQGQTLKALLAQAELANYNRELINWRIGETNYRNYVLSPVIEPSSIFAPQSSNLGWRRPLWESFYPLIRHESSPADAAKIVVQHLREDIAIVATKNAVYDITAIWQKRIADETGFQTICVAALRSVGVPARLNSQHEAEFFDGNNWHSITSLGVAGRLPEGTN